MNKINSIHYSLSIIHIYSYLFIFIHINIHIQIHHIHVIHIHIHIRSFIRLPGKGGPFWLNGILNLRVEVGEVGAGGTHRHLKMVLKLSDRSIFFKCFPGDCFSLSFLFFCLLFLFLLFVCFIANCFCFSFLFFHLYFVF